MRVLPMRLTVVAREFVGHRYGDGMGLNPFRAQAKRGTDLVIVAIALAVVAALVLWAVFG
jgi:ABC-type nitrate/sulfonate/bicarbonate transport system permease component